MHFQEHFSSPQNSIRLYMAPFSKKPFSCGYQKTLEKSGVHNISKQFKGKIHAKKPLNSTFFYMNRPKFSILFAVNYHPLILCNIKAFSY